MLSVSMDPFGEMAPEAQAFYRKAGIHPRHLEQVPTARVGSVLAGEGVPCKTRRQSAA